MKPVDNELLLNQLHWRYATKQFDAQRKISSQDWQTLEQAMMLAPSSWGLQPWKFFVVTNPELRKKVQGVAFGQAQVVDASHLVIFTIKKNLTVADVDHFIAHTAEVRGVTTESLAAYRNIIAASVNRPPEAMHEWNSRQAYIALGFFLSAAAMLGIDACPMEGFVPAKMDEVLGLDQQGYTSVVIATAGYRSAQDKYAELAKVRYPRDEIVTTLA